MPYHFQRIRSHLYYVLYNLQSWTHSNLLRQEDWDTLIWHRAGFVSTTGAPQPQAGQLDPGWQTRRVAHTCLSFSKGNPRFLGTNVMPTNFHNFPSFFISKLPRWFVRRSLRFFAFVRNANPSPEVLLSSSVQLTPAAKTCQTNFVRTWNRQQVACCIAMIVRPWFGRSFY